MLDMSRRPLFIAHGLPRLFGTAEDLRVHALADRLGVLGPAMSEFTAQIRHSRPTIRWSQPEMMPNLLKLFKIDAG